MGRQDDIRAELARRAQGQRMQQGLQQAGLSDPRRIPESKNEAARAAEMTPEGGSVEPSWDPADVAMMGLGTGPKLGAAAVGETASGMAKAPGGLARLLTRGATGLDNQGMSAAIKNPGLLSLFRAGNEAASQQAAKAAMNTVGEDIGTRAGSFSNVLESKMAGKTIPAQDISQSSAFLAKEGTPIAADPMTGQVPMSSVNTARRNLGNGEKWVLDPKTGTFTKVTDPEAGAAYQNLRGAMRTHAPELDPTMQSIGQAAEANKALGAGRQAPLSFMRSGGDMAAARQQASQLAPRAALEDTAQTLQAADTLASDKGGIVKRTVSGLGEHVGLPTARALTNAGEKVAPLARFVGRGAGGAAGAVAQPALTSSLHPDAESGPAPEESDPRRAALIQELERRRKGK